MAVLSKAGDHVPVIGVASIEDVGNALNASPGHIGVTGENVGVAFWLTVITNNVAVEHCPALGVKV